jgi:hypothetical protein
MTSVDIDPIWCLEGRSFAMGIPVGVRPPKRPRETISQSCLAGSKFLCSLAIANKRCDLISLRLVFRLICGIKRDGIFYSRVHSPFVVLVNFPLVTSRDLQELWDVVTVGKQ